MDHCWRVFSRSNTKNSKHLFESCKNCGLIRHKFKLASDKKYRITEHYTTGYNTLTYRYWLYPELPPNCNEMIMEEILK